MGQLSFWSADARPRGLDDLEGLLCGPGYAELFGRGSAARLVIVLGAEPEPEPEGELESEEESVEDEPEELEAPLAIEAAPDLDPDDLAFLDLDPDELAARLGLAPSLAPAAVSPPRAGGFPGVERQRGPHAGTQATTTHAKPDDPVARWRARAVCCALRVRGVPAEVGCAGDGRPEVRTAFRSDLVDLARRWTTPDGMKAVPEGFELDGPRLGLWVLAAGAHEGRAYTLGLDPGARDLDEVLLTASRRAGLGAALAGPGRPPALRVVGTRRQRRLGELVGRPPRDLTDGVWPV
ncbi:hypothetical protein ACQPX6_02540 [Actinomycetospora sp. CA-101289]|uniref:hypothetical protein n=1 Tax=Actinomycetospora sp. CA-101289 TaxID=3239893 RepID=UPI003D96F2ED